MVLYFTLFNRHLPKYSHCIPGQTLACLFDVLLDIVAEIERIAGDKTQDDKH